MMSLDRDMANKPNKFDQLYINRINTFVRVISLKIKALIILVSP